MSEVNFGVGQTSVDESAAETEAARLEAGGAINPNEVTGPTGVGLPATRSNDPFVMGDYLPGFRDIILPRLNIVQGSGKLKDSFPQGAIVFDQKLELFTLPIVDKQTGNIKVPGLPPVNITILGFRPTRFVEKIAGGERGLIVNTEAQVREAGGTLDYGEWKLKASSGMKRFETLAEAFVVVRRPAHVANDGSIFTFDIGDDAYALALWGMKGTAYTHAAKRVFFTARKMGILSKTGYPSWNFNITTRPETFAGNNYFVPVCLPGARSTPDMLAFVGNILNPVAAPESAE
jgi:hypothetical protein